MPVHVEISTPRRGSPVQRLFAWLAMGGPIGLIPWVPATWASLLTALACRALAPYMRSPEALVLWAVIFMLGGWACGAAELCLGSHDPRNVVLDEISGQWLVFLLAPGASWPAMLAGFGLFRFFDVVKPFPARQFERLPAGWGIMADDAMAGIYAGFALWLLLRWL